jgi:hypothetical protein
MHLCAEERTNETNERAHRTMHSRKLFIRPPRKHKQPCKPTRQTDADRDKQAAPRDVRYEITFKHLFDLFSSSFAAF